MSVSHFNPYGIGVGDEVIIGPSPKDKHAGPGWVSDMEEMVGEIGIIYSAGATQCMVEVPGRQTYSYLYSWVTPIDEPNRPLKVTINTKFNVGDRIIGLSKDIYDRPIKGLIGKVRKNMSVGMSGNYIVIELYSPFLNEKQTYTVKEEAIAKWQD